MRFCIPLQPGQMGPLESGLAGISPDVPVPALSFMPCLGLLLKPPFIHLPNPQWPVLECFNLRTFISDKSLSAPKESRHSSEKGSKDGQKETLREKAGSGAVQSLLRAAPNNTDAAMGSPTSF